MVLLILTACQGIQPSQNKDSIPIQNFRFGSEGIRAEFVNNLPPLRIFDTEPLSVTLRVENRGTSTVGGPLDRKALQKP